MTKELRDYLIKTYGLKDDVKDGALELTYPRTIAAYEEGYEQAKKDNTPQWHYPSKGELPEEGEEVWIYAYEKHYNDKGVRRAKRIKGDVWTSPYSDYLTKDIVAWRYIDPPEVKDYDKT